MPDILPDDSRKLARLYEISQIGMEMAIPAGLGFALDYWLGTLPWLTVVGAIVGPVVGFWHLLAILKTPLPPDDKPKL